MASILLAFAIDAWHDGSSDRRLEADYQQRIAEELSAVRSALSYEADGINRSIEAGKYASAFFDNSEEHVDSGQLVASLFYMGLDALSLFDVSTYEDLISTGRLGLISDVERRTAIQRAYSQIERAELALRPYRDEYLKGIRAWIPSRVQQQLRDVCVGRVGFDCSPIALQGADAEMILEHFASDEAVLAFRLREQGLLIASSLTERAIDAVDAALEVLD